jgi:hypothetical protein
MEGQVSAAIVTLRRLSNTAFSHLQAFRSARHFAHWRQAFLALIAVALVGIAAARIVSTYRIFSQTFDEPAHVAAGMEWRDAGTYTLEPLPPPLARVAVALGLFLDGLRFTVPDPSASSIDHMWEEGNALLYAGGRYSRHLTLARLGVLPFFLATTGLVWAWSRILFGAMPA